MSLPIQKRSRQSEILDRNHQKALRIDLFLLLAGERAGQGAQTKPVEQPVEAERAQQAVDDTAETKAAEQAAHDAEHTREQEADGSNDLEERLAQEAPEGVELLLGVRHVLKLALGALDGLGNSTGKLWSAS